VNSLICDTFTRLDSLIYKGFKRPLVSELVPNQVDDVNVHLVAEEFASTWNERVQKNGVNFARSDSRKKVKVSLWRHLASHFLGRNIFSTFLGLLFFMLFYSGPLLLKLLICHIQDESEEAWKGFFYAGLLFSTLTLGSLVNQQFLKQQVRTNGG